MEGSPPLGPPRPAIRIDADRESVDSLGRPRSPAALFCASGCHGSLKGRLAKEATQLRKEAQGTPPGFERELLDRKARRAETASRMIEWLTSAPKHQDRFK